MQQEQSAPPFCRDCKWASTTGLFLKRVHKSSKCLHTLGLRDEGAAFVLGTSDLDSQFYCSTMRGEYGKCGAVGKLFEPRRLSATP